MTALLSIWDLCDRIKACKGNARSLALHCLAIMQALADATSAADEISFPASLLGKIDRFYGLLSEVYDRLDCINRQHTWQRLLHLKTNEDDFGDLRERLERAKDAFQIVSMTRTEIGVAQTQAQLHDLSEYLIDMKFRLNILAGMTLGILLFMDGSEFDLFLGPGKGVAFQTRRSDRWIRSQQDLHELGYTTSVFCKGDLVQCDRSSMVEFMRLLVAACRLTCPVTSTGDPSGLPTIFLLC